MAFQVKAIETKYKGYRFRSRLEARWAVFFDTLGVDWEYEPEGYDLDGVWYLPDFFIKTWDKFVEIKPTVPTEEEEDKCVSLANSTGKDVLMICGSPYVGYGVPEPEGGYPIQDFGQYCAKYEIVIYTRERGGEEEADDIWDEWMDCNGWWKSQFSRRGGGLFYKSFDHPNAIWIEQPSSIESRHSTEITTEQRFQIIPIIEGLRDYIGWWDFEEGCPNHPDLEAALVAARSARF